MRKLDNILDLEHFTALMSEGKKSPHSSYILYQECVSQALQWICQDRTTTRDNLHEKAKNYALNYLATHPEPSINKDDVAQQVADEIEKTLQNKCFDQRPIASVLAQDERDKIPKDPDERFIKLSP